ncbi:unnamed protein product [Effrenium voratum]|nr:unnamed protein product [Effrenium voratum]
MRPVPFLALPFFLRGAAASAAFVSLATNDYYAKGALVTLHSVHLHGGADRVLLVPGGGVSSWWRQRFRALKVKVVEVRPLRPSKALQRAMRQERARLQEQGLLEVLQPISYGGAFVKVHAWDPALGYEKVVLLDGDLLAKRSLRPLLRLPALSAGKDLSDAFNYGVVVLKPDAEIHAGLVKLLGEATEADLQRYNSRTQSEAGLCDQTLVAGWLAERFRVNFFEDLARKRKPALMSSEFNLVVSYRAKDRCDDPVERRAVEKARILHFANHWLNFEALVADRDAPGRVDSPRCYKAGFRYWHDVYHHALQVAAGEEGPAPRYQPLSDEGLSTPEEVKAVFLNFQQIKEDFEGGSEEL